MTQRTVNPNWGRRTDQTNRVVARVARELGDPAVDPLAKLTPAETAVLRLLAAGLSQRRIAAALGLSQQTVKNQLWSAYGKLGLRRMGPHDEDGADNKAARAGYLIGLYDSLGREE